ncbi:MAG: carboxypeptidase-like regulatory domain-containing protein [Bacteroidetes bacterium]|nr:carboxypeptidase-like regulatory domain-containing protein [Bacteroidota bacterium]
MKKFLALIFLFAIRFSLFAGNTNGDVIFMSGNVTDKTTHETLAGVQVHVIGTDINVYTDFDGNFFIPNLPRGSYQLEFSYITYKTTQVVNDPETSGCDYCSTLSVEIQQN